MKKYVVVISHELWDHSDSMTVAQVELTEFDYISQIDDNSEQEVTKVKVAVYET